MDYTDIETAAIEKLKEIPEFKLVEAWNGEITEDDIKRMTRFPAAYVVFKSSDLSEIDNITHEENMVFSVLVFVKNLKGQDALGSVAVDLVESILKKLTNQVLLADLRRVVPKSWELFYLAQTIMGYGIDFQTGFDRTFS